MNTRKNYGRITWGRLAGITAIASCLFLAQLAGQTPLAQAPATDAGQQPGPAVKVESRLALVVGKSRREEVHRCQRGA